MLVVNPDGYRTNNESLAMLLKKYFMGSGYSSGQ